MYIMTFELYIQYAPSQSGLLLYTVYTDRSPFLCCKTRVSRRKQQCIQCNLLRGPDDSGYPCKVRFKFQMTTLRSHIPQDIAQIFLIKQINSISILWDVAWICLKKQLSSISSHFLLTKILKNQLLRLFAPSAVPPGGFFTPPHQRELICLHPME